VVDIFSYGELLIYRTQNALIVGKQAFAATVTMNCGLFPQLFRIIFLPYLVHCLLSSLAVSEEETMLSVCTIHEFSFFRITL
jgi:hypothetical protein